MKQGSGVQWKIERRFCLERLSVDSNKILGHVGENGPAAGIGANVRKGSVEEDFFDGEIDVGPHPLEATAVIIGTSVTAIFVALDAGRIDDTAVHDAKHFADRNVLGAAREKIAAVNASFAGDDAAATEFKENLFEVFDGNAVAVGDLMYGDNFRIFHREMENSAGGVLAFGRNSHGIARVDFHSGKAVSTLEKRFSEMNGVPTKLAVKAI